MELGHQKGQQPPSWKPVRICFRFLHELIYKSHQPKKRFKWRSRQPPHLHSINFNDGMTTPPPFSVFSLNRWLWISTFSFRGGMITINLQMISIYFILFHCWETVVSSGQLQRGNLVPDPTSASSCPCTTHVRVHFKDH